MSKTIDDASSAAAKGCCGDPVIPLASGEHPPFEGAVKVAGPLDASQQHHHSARTKARKAALDLLFEADLLGRDVLDLMDESVINNQAPVREFTDQIVRGVRHHGMQIDQRISECSSPDWTLARMPRIDRNLARIAIWELDNTAIAARAAISEALELADELSTDTSVAFLNGLLSNAANSRLTPMAVTTKEQQTE